jgi:adenylate cyclase
VMTRMPTDAEKAILLLERALGLDPDYALAHAALAWCFHARFLRAGKRPEDDVATLRHARAAATLGGDDATALALAAFTIATSRERDSATALGLFDRALALSPSSVLALGYSALTLVCMGNADAAIERAERALRLSPFDWQSTAAHNALAIALFLKQRYTEAIEATRRSAETNPRFAWTYAFMAASLVRSGHTEDASQAARQVLELSPRFTIAEIVGVFFAGPEVTASIVDAMRQAGLPE